MGVATSRSGCTAAPRRRHPRHHQPLRPPAAAPARRAAWSSRSTTAPTSTTPTNYRVSFFYDLVKASVGRMAFALAHELAPHGATAVSLTPGLAAVGGDARRLRGDRGRPGTTRTKVEPALRHLRDAALRRPGRRRAGRRPRRGPLERAVAVERAAGQGLRLHRPRRQPARRLALPRRGPGRRASPPTSPATAEACADRSPQGGLVRENWRAMVDGVERARAAFARRAWAEAFGLLSTRSGAGRRGPAAPRDGGAALRSTWTRVSRAWERAYAAYHRARASGGASRCACLARARAHAPRRGGASGRLAGPGRAGSLASWAHVRGRGLPPAAGVLRGARIRRRPCRRTAHLAREMVEHRCSVAGPGPDRVRPARLGQAAIASGDTAHGMRFLDEVMVAVTTGEVSPIPAGIVYCAVLEACVRHVRRRSCRDVDRGLPRRGASASPTSCRTGASASCTAPRSCRRTVVGRRRRPRWSRHRAALRAAPPGPGARPVPAGRAAPPSGGACCGRGRVPRRANEQGRDPSPGLALLRLAQGERHGRCRSRPAHARRERWPGRTDRRVLAAAVEILLAVR